MADQFKDGKEGWKEYFFDQISQKYGIDNIIKAENPDYRLIGLPFFNEKRNNKKIDYSFTKSFNELILKQKL